MKHPMILLGAALCVLPLAGCAEGPTHSRLYVGMSYPYYGYYDGFYGPIYDGYWGSNGYFYYRLTPDGHFRRGDRDHFRRDGRDLDRRFHRFEGTLRPKAEMRMPHFDGGRDRRGDRDRRDDRRRDDH